MALRLAVWEFFRDFPTFFDIHSYLRVHILLVSHQGFHALTRRWLLLVPAFFYWVNPELVGIYPNSAFVIPM